VNRARLNYVLDGLIGLAFVACTVSSLVFLAAGSGGYQGGRNPSFQTAILGISRWTWSDVHTWTGLAVVAGVAIHLLLHWRWIVGMTKGMLRPRAAAAPSRADDAALRPLRNTPDPL
jgi:hypothetical protein